MDGTPCTDYGNGERESVYRTQALASRRKWIYTEAEKDRVISGQWIRKGRSRSVLKWEPEGDTDSYFFKHPSPICCFNMDGFFANMIKYLLFATNFLVFVSIITA